MEQSFENENTCDVFMNEIKIYYELLPKHEEMGNFQIEGSRNVEMNDTNLKKLLAQKVFWKRNSNNALCWAFYCVNDNKEVNIATPQIMHYILCHNNPILNENPKTQARKGLIIYNTTNGIATLKKHVNSDHFNVLKNFEEKVNCPLRQDEIKLSIKRRNISFYSIFDFFVTKEPFKKDDV